VIAKTVELAGRALRRAGTALLRRNGMSGVWIDVGAHHGETTLGYANHNPGLTIFAFEPNLRAAVSLIGRAPNYIVIPMAVAEIDGHADFHINAFDAASSLLPIDESTRRSWTGGEALRVESTVSVPTIRLDTFMRLAEIGRVEFLKIDAQGADLAVLRSAGSRLANVVKITLEVDVTTRRLYQGSASKAEVVTFLAAAGFRLIGEETQSHGHEENLTFARSTSAHDLESE
jgi:FkbM family methyltransferase